MADKKQFMVLWGATVVLETIVEAESEEEARKMAMNNDLSVKEARLKECYVEDATAMPVINVT